jgi:hypothetical protein
VDRDVATFGFQHLAGRLVAKALDKGHFEPSDDDKVRIERARSDINEFIEYVFRDEYGAPIVQAPVHRLLQRIADEHPRVVIRLPPEFGKTKQLTIYRTLWRLGHDPNRLVAFISETAQSQAWKWVSEVREHIESNVRLHQVFPELKQGRKWSAPSITVDRTIVSGEPSVTGLGTYGRINSARLTDVVMDDVLSFENTYSEAQRDKLREWTELVVLNRLLTDGRFLFLGHAWSHRDLGSDLAKRPGWSEVRLPAFAGTIEELKRAEPEPKDAVPRVCGGSGRLLWPGRWGVQRLRDKLEDIGTRFSRVFLQQDGTDSDWFPAASVEKALRAGLGQSAMDRYACKPSERVVIGCDLATGEDKRKADITVFRVWLLSNGKKRYLWTESDRRERWKPEQRIAKVGELNERFMGPGGKRPEFRVESNLGQQHFINNIRLTYGERVFVTASYTGVEKRHPQLGVEGIALEMERGNVILPAVMAQDDRGQPRPMPADDEIAMGCQAYRDYDPSDRHIPDYLAADWLAFGGLGMGSSKPKAGAGSAGTKTAWDYGA